MDFTRLNIKGLLGASAVTLSGNMTLPEKDRAFVLIVQATASGKTLTLDLPDDACCIVVTIDDSNAYTLKNVSGDSGASISPESIYLVKASREANGTMVVQLVAGGGRSVNA
jgi:hypothetical protein